MKKWKCPLCYGTGYSDDDCVLKICTACIEPMEFMGYLNGEKENERD